MREPAAREAANGNSLEKMFPDSMAGPRPRSWDDDGPWSVDTGRRDVVSAANGRGVIVLEKRDGEEQGTEKEIKNTRSRERLAWETGRSVHLFRAATCFASKGAPGMISIPTTGVKLYCVR